MRGPGNVIHRALRIAGYAAAGFAALTCALLFLITVTLTGSRRAGLALALIFAFTTPHFTTHHNALWSHNTVLPFVLLALWLVPFRGGRHVALAGAPLGIAYVIRPDAAESDQDK